MIHALLVLAVILLVADAQRIGPKPTVKTID